MSAPEPRQPKVGATPGGQDKERGKGIPGKFVPVLFEPGVSVTSYLANDPEQVFSWISARVEAVAGQTDKYSTIEERRAYSEALATEMKDVGALAVIADCLTSYDAERQAFTVTTSMGLVHPGPHDQTGKERSSFRRITVASKNVRKETYIAQNAYGASIEVERKMSDDYAIAFAYNKYSFPASALARDTISNPAREPMLTKLSFSFPMPSKEARETDKSLACLYVFSPIPPYVHKSEERLSPTREWPFDYRSTVHSVVGKLDQVAVINRVTGEIYDQAARTRD